MQNNRCHRVKCLSVDNVRMAFNSMSSVSLFHCYSKMVFIFSSTRLIHSIVRHLDSTLILCKFLVNMQSKRLCVSSSSKKKNIWLNPLCTENNETLSDSAFVEYLIHSTDIHCIWIIEIWLKCILRLIAICLHLNFIVVQKAWRRKGLFLLWIRHFDSMIVSFLFHLQYN